ncbi:hypothetical protein B1F73_11640 [Pseudomonas syringae]|nr:hypothetical protein B1F72_18065 [Pseudomonas syringae]RXT84061.1 hypothetical protein B1F72_18130 [Pseudomonas syringae]RXU00002.1 hypothetical protein B1F73_11575 [Pseudomonas syringae]RXU00012.1 hypothetical protein B1F73_11640 [Pseudomonas syringae]
MMLHSHRQTEVKGNRLIDANYDLPEQHPLHRYTSADLLSTYLETLKELYLADRNHQSYRQENHGYMYSQVGEVHYLGWYRYKCYHQGMKHHLIGGLNCHHRRLKLLQNKQLMLNYGHRQKRKLSNCNLEH